MPISREELERGLIDLTFPIARILTSRPDLGFSPEEIQQLLVEVDGRTTTLHEIEQALESLSLQERAQMTEIDGRRWYTIAQ